MVKNSAVYGYHPNNENHCSESKSWFSYMIVKNRMKSAEYNWDFPLDWRRQMVNAMHLCSTFQHLHGTAKHFILASLLLMHTHSDTNEWLPATMQCVDSLIGHHWGLTSCRWTFQHRAGSMTTYNVWIIENVNRLIWSSTLYIAKHTLRKYFTLTTRLTARC